MHDAQWSGRATLLLLDGPLPGAPNDRSMDRVNEPSVALVTGAASGIGRATAYRLAEAGYVVAAIDIDQRGADAVARAIGGRAFIADVADAEAVTRVVDMVETQLGSIELAISNAGVYNEVPLGSVTDQEWQRMLRVHLGGAFNVSRAVVAPMRRRSAGSIVLVSSELALAGSPRAVAYVAAKAALVGLGRSLARELAPAIRVNVIAPGPIDTPLLLDRERTPQAIGAIPLGRLGRPEEIAEAIAHLADARFTTGAVYSPNGGIVIQ
jgi:NAD(P)-dependent dehydrogenase (short-subunit alcohol dehydrogenase family)